MNTNWPPTSFLVVLVNDSTEYKEWQRPSALSITIHHIFHLSKFECSTMLRPEPDQQATAASASKPSLLRWLLRYVLPCCSCLSLHPSPPPSLSPSTSMQPEELQIVATPDDDGENNRLTSPAAATEIVTAAQMLVVAQVQSPTTPDTKPVESNNHDKHHDKKDGGTATAGPAGGARLWQAPCFGRRRTAATARSITRLLTIANGAKDNIVPVTFFFMSGTGL